MYYSLLRMRARAFAQFREMQKDTAMSLKRAIEQHKATGVQIDVKPSYIIIPNKGLYNRSVHKDL